MTATLSPQPRRGHFQLTGHRRTLRIGRLHDLRRLRKLVPPAIGVAAIAALATAVDPTQFSRAIEHFRVAVLPAIVLVSLAYYLLQGVRWHQLLRAVGIRIELGDTVLLNFAGQATALLPLGELTRAVLVTEETGAEFGAVVATVTVQELLYTMVLIAFAVPGLIAVPHALSGVSAALGITMLIFVALSWCPAYRVLRALVERTPVLRRFTHEVDELHNDTVLLMRHRSTLTGMWISVLQAAATITTLWLVAEAVAPGALTWRDAALVYAVSNVAGALSLIPGGIGAYEASVVGLLVTFGMNPGVAAAVALVHRFADKGLATGVGFAAYFVARRRLHVSGLGTVPVRKAA
jgi:glycosyltransferase 2 family protein